MFLRSYSKHIDKLDRKDDAMDDQESLEELHNEFRRVHRQFVGVGGVAVLVLLVGAVFYHYQEHLSWLNAFYFCTITLTTIGYGDIVPVTSLGKLFTIGYVIIGIGILAAFANLLIKNAMARRQFRRYPRSK